MKELREIEEQKEPFWKRPMIIILGIFLLLLIITMFIPYYSIKLDPSPSYIPEISEVTPENIEIQENATQNYLELIKPNDPIIKQTADKILSLSGCKSHKICQAKSLFFFVRDKFNYVSDPLRYEYIKSPRESLSAKGGDCDDASVLLANLLESIGITTRFVFIPGHVYIQAYMPDALARYKEIGWVNMDATCSYCDFGEIPYTTADKDKRYLG